MRIRTKLQILSIITCCIMFISCEEENEGSGIPEVDVTRELLLGSWNIEKLIVGEGVKSATITQTTEAIGDDGMSNEVEVFDKFKFTLTNDVLASDVNFTVQFLEDSRLNELGMFNDVNEKVLATVNGDRLFEEVDTEPTSLQYESAFFDSLLGVIDASWEIVDKNTIVVSGFTNEGRIASTRLDVKFFSQDIIRVSYELSDDSPFFGTDALTLLEQNTLVIEDNFSLVGDLLKPFGTVTIDFRRSAEIQ